MTQAAAVPWDVKLMNATAITLFVLFALLLAGALLVRVARQPLFAIAGIVVSGEVTHSNAVTLRANVASRLSGTFFTIDLSRARQAFEAVPWVRQAVVRRVFPNRLNVTLQEHKAVAYWGGEGDAKLLNSFGEVFEANLGEVEQDGLPRLNGPDGQAPQVMAMYEALQPLFEFIDLGLEQLDLTAHGGWRARLDGGAVLELGAGSVSEVVARTERFLKTLTQVTSRYQRKPDALETADLRHQDAYAIRLRGVTTLAAAGSRK